MGPEVILGATIAVISLIAIAVQANLLSKQAFAGFILALVLVVSGGNLVLSLANNSNFRRELGSVCLGQKEIARTGAEALEELKESNATFLIKGSIPGYTAKELRELTLQKSGRETERVKRLENVANNTCEGAIDVRIRTTRTP